MGPKAGVLAKRSAFAKTLAAAVAVILASCSGAGLDSLPSRGEGTVLAASDDGRVRLDDGRTVRLAGVDTADGAGLDLMLAGQRVELLAAGTDASVVHVRLRRRRRWVQGALLDAGLARVRTSRNEAALAGAMLSREARSRAARRGLWAGRWRVLTAREAEHARGFQIVEGRVRSAKALRRGVFLDFGDDWRRDLSVEVPEAALDRLAAAGLDPEMLEGRLVRVRGRLQPTRNGPLITLDHPEAVELLSDR